MVREQMVTKRKNRMAAALEAHNKGDNTEPSPGMLIAAIIARAYYDIKPYRGKGIWHRVDAAHYFGSELFEYHCSLIELDADWVRDKVISDWIPPCYLRTVALAKLHDEFLSTKLTVAQVARAHALDPATLAYNWGLMRYRIEWRPTISRRPKKAVAETRPARKQQRAAPAAQQMAYF